MPASSIGPSWAQRGSREARLAFRQAQKRGDREGAMRIAGEADKQGLASQASIGSAEERLAGQYQGRGADTAVTAEIETALTPPGPGRADGQPTKIMTPAGERNAPRGGVQEETARTMELRPGPTSVASRFQQSQDVISGTTPRTVQPSIPEQPPAPGASQPPENPVSGSSTPVTGDPESRLGIRRGSFALQGLAGRQALSENLRKSIAAGGGDLSGDRLKRAKAEADRLGVTPEQFLSELQDIGVSVPGEDMKTLTPQDNRSLDQRLRDYQDKYLGGGPTSEMPARLRADSAANQTAAESMRRARPAPAPAPAPPAPPVPASPTPAPTPILARPAPSRSTLVGGSPAELAPAPTTAPSLPFRLGQAAKSFSEINFPDAAVAAAEGFARRERSGYERIAAAGEAKVDEGIAKARRAIGLATLRVTDRNRRTADTLRRIREEFAAGRTGNPQR